MLDRLGAKRFSSGRHCNFGRARSRLCRPKVRRVHLCSGQKITSCGHDRKPTWILLDHQHLIHLFRLLLLFSGSRRRLSWKLGSLYLQTRSNRAAQGHREGVRLRDLVRDGQRNPGELPETLSRLLASTLALGLNFISYFESNHL